MRNKILLTGKNSFIGNMFGNTFIDKYDVVYADYKNNKPSTADFENIDVVIHIAAIVHQFKDVSDELYEQVNVELTKNIFECAKEAKVKHFIFLSTMAVYGDEGTTKESTPLNIHSACQPKSKYGISKLKAEQYLLHESNDDMMVSIIRPPMVYGEGDKGNMLRLIKMIDKLPVVPMKYKRNKRSVLYVRHLIEYLSIVIEEEKTGILLPQDNFQPSAYDIAIAIQKGLGKKKVFIPVPRFVLNILSKKVNMINKIYGSLVYEQNDVIKDFKYDFETAIKNECQWYLNEKNNISQ